MADPLATPASPPGNPQAPPAPPPSGGVPTPPSAPLADVEKLRSEVARLTSALASRQAEKEVADRAAAEKRGEWEVLYGTEKARAATIEQQLAAEKTRREEYEGHLKSEIDAALAAISDETVRKDVADSIAGLDLLRQRKLLGAFAATSAAPKTTRPGAPGSPRGGADYKLMSSPGAAGTRYRADLALAALEVAKGK